MQKVAILCCCIHSRLLYILIWNVDIFRIYFSFVSKKIHCLFRSFTTVTCWFWANSMQGFIRFQLSKEKKTLEDRVTELSSHLAEEEERSKAASKQKSKLEALVADLEERLRKEQEVSYISMILINHQDHCHVYRLFVFCLWYSSV